MAIAGIEPVSYLNLGNGHTDEIYSRDQVREILVKHIAKLTKHPLLQIMEPKQYGEIVDEFMESGEQ